MKCPVCGSTDIKVLETRSVEDDSAIRRRRECNSCRARFTTLETVIAADPLMVCKRDNTREQFDRNKILSGISKACQKRPISVRQMEEIIDGIEAELLASPNLELPTHVIGERIMTTLRKLDDVAYIRFVSVYKKFDDMDSFIEVIEKMKLGLI